MRRNYNFCRSAMWPTAKKIYSHFYIWILSTFMYLCWDISRHSCTSGIRCKDDHVLSIPLHRCPHCSYSKLHEVLVLGDYIIPSACLHTTNVCQAVFTWRVLHQQWPLNQHPCYFPPSSGPQTSTERQGQLSPVAPLGWLSGSGTVTPGSAKVKTKTKWRFFLASFTSLVGSSSSSLPKLIPHPTPQAPSWDDLKSLVHRSNYSCN